MSYRVRVACLTAACLVCAGNVARAQLVESPFQSEEAKEEGVPFRGSTFGFLQSLSSDSLLRSNYLSYNPTYSWGFALDLFWHFNRVFQLGLNQELEVELTDSDTTTLNRQLLLSDTTVTLGATLLQRSSSAHDWSLNASGGLIAPTSIASQAATMVLGTRLGLSGGFTFTKVMNGLALNGLLTYQHRFMTDNVVQADAPYPCNAGATSQATCTQLGTATNTRNAIVVGAGADLALNDAWGVRFQASHSWKRAADLADYTYTSDDGTEHSLPDDSVTHWRNSTTLEIGVGYLVASWLGLSFNVTNSFKDRGIDSELRAPLHLVDTYFGLNASLRLDEVYLSASGKSSGGGFGEE
ncbi:MAG TPA: hypothetical protein VJR89_25225 [Polyangiales bacterium]|nr:hypothetical protein [Polyangiales bacterium]